MANVDTLDLLHNHMFRKTDDLTDKQREQLTRYEAAFVVWLDKPWIPDKELRNFLMNQFGLSQSQAYNDLHALKSLFGNVRNTSKEWYRYLANELVKTAIEELDECNTKFDFFNCQMKIKAAEALVKINRLNKLDIDPIDYSSIIPQNFDPTNDPQEAGLKGMTRKSLRNRINELIKKYDGEIEIEDVDYDEIPRKAGEQ